MSLPSHSGIYSICNSSDIVQKDSELCILNPLEKVSDLKVYIVQLPSTPLYMQ